MKTVPHDDPESMSDLLSKLVEAIALLDRIGEERWATWLRSDLAHLQRGDANGLNHLLSAYGGMGSLNDLYIDPANGHPVTAAEAVALDAEWRALCNDMYKVARALRR